MVKVVRVAASACLLLIGCFTLAPFNDLPTIRPGCEFPDGRPCGDNAIVHRGERFSLRMIVSDGDDNEDKSTYRWEAFACTVPDGTGCLDAPYDAQPYDEELPSGTEIEIPANLPGDIASISVDFEARDDRGGIGAASLVFPLAGASAPARHPPRRMAHSP